MHWASIVFGWPFVIVAITAFAVGLFTRAKWLLLWGSVFAAPFCLYLSGTPRFRWYGLIALFMNFMSVWAQSRGRSAVAAVSVVPFVGLVAFVATIVWQQ